MWERADQEPGSSCECGAFSYELCALNQASSFIGYMDVLSPGIIFLLFVRMHVTSCYLLRNSILRMQGNIITEIKRRLITSFLFPEHRPRLR